MTSYGFLLTIGHEAEQVEEAMNKPLPTLTENPETLYGFFMKSGPSLLE